MLAPNSPLLSLELDELRFELCDRDAILVLVIVLSPIAVLDLYVFKRSSIFAALHDVS